MPSQSKKGFVFLCASKDQDDDAEDHDHDDHHDDKDHDDHDEDGVDDMLMNRPASSAVVHLLCTRLRLRVQLLACLHVFLGFSYGPKRLVGPNKVL